MSAMTRQASDANLVVSSGKSPVVHCSGYTSSGCAGGGGACASCGAESKLRCETHILEARGGRAFSSGSSGILHHIGTQGGKEAHANPHDAGSVKVSWSSVGFGSEAAFVDHSCRGKDIATGNTHGRGGQWMQVDLLHNNRVAQPTSYCIRHGDKDGGVRRLRRWKLSGSHDGKVWTVIDERDQFRSPLPNRGHSTGDFNICDPTARCSGVALVDGKLELGWRYLRLTQTGRHVGGGNALSCAGFEIYGKLVTESSGQ
jgi:hypothetical protein